MTTPAHPAQPELVGDTTPSPGTRVFALLVLGAAMVLLAIFAMTWIMLAPLIVVILVLSCGIFITATGMRWTSSKTTAALLPIAFFSTYGFLALIPPTSGNILVGPYVEQLFLVVTAVLLFLPLLRRSTLRGSR